MAAADSASRRSISTWALGALGVARGDAVIERLAAGAQVGVVLRDVIQAGTQLGGKRLPTLERLAHLALSFIVEVARPVAAMPRFTED